MKTTLKFFATLIVASLALIVLVPGVSAASDDEAVVGNDLVWVLVCSALVFIMTPGVALFYGGMLRKQSMTSVLAQTCVVMGIMVLSWTVVGYSLAFGTDINGIIGNLDYMMIHGLDDITVGTIPAMEFVLFQMMFALITAGIVLGACLERVRFNAICVFILFWSVLVYAPMAHWVWGGGVFDQNLTVLDFAGGTVVHICAATTGLALVLFSGRRSERMMKDRAHNIPMTFIGFALLCFGWIGFNGGSGLAANGVAINAILVSLISFAAAMSAWGIIQYIHAGRVGVLGLITGGITGLVSITPAAGYVGPSEALIIGAAGSVICYFAVILMRKKSHLDDALDVFAIHGVGGIWGAIATGIFALPSMVSPGYQGLIYGGIDLFVGQIIAVVVTLAFCFVVSYVIIWVISRFMKVCLTEDEEIIGADIVDHGEPAYNL